ncbi:MAG: putative GH43/DUF377 family glycosyl hydrolase [Marinoscillum sp.]|jgi:predicted GH43/DUF377 family glycosyl hydrolase
MYKLKKEGVILDITDLEFENEGVLNPAVIQEGNKVHIFYRAVRKGNHSTIGYCRLDGPMNIAHRNNAPLLAPHFEYESKGVEDPRIVKIDNLYYLTFTAYDGANAMGALATSKDLINFERQGIIVPQITYDDFHRMAECNLHLNEKYKRLHFQNNVDSRHKKEILLSDKNAMFFPRKINGKFYFIHRIKPDIQIASVDSIDELTSAFWQDYMMSFDQHILLAPRHEHEISYIGGGCPPIETKDGWLLIYHGVYDAVEGYVYSACAALLDLNDPTKEIARLPYPFFKPEETWELKGEVNNVVFPTGTALFDDTLYIYYGAADTRIAVASVSLSEVIEELLKHRL